MDSSCGALSCWSLLLGRWLWLVWCAGPAAVIAAAAACSLLTVVIVLAQVEMFVVCTPEQSDALHQELIQIEQELFTELGLHFKVGGMRRGGQQSCKGTDRHTGGCVCVC